MPIFDAFNGWSLFAVNEEPAAVKKIISICSTCSGVVRLISNLDVAYSSNKMLINYTVPVFRKFCCCENAHVHKTTNAY